MTGYGAVPRFRTFIAVPIDEAVRARAAALQEDLRAAGARLRWVRPSHLHFTIRFLGELPAAQVARAVVVTREAVRGVAPFTITIAGLGAFPSFERPQVVWIGTSAGVGAFAALAERISGALERARFALEARPFRPHLTLGRARDDRRWSELVRALQRFRDVSLGEQVVDQVLVMESRLEPDGPVYSVREQVPLPHRLNSSGE